MYSFSLAYSKIPNGPAVIEFHKHIDIAAGIGISTRNRAEHGGVRPAEQPQLAFVSTKRLQHVVN